MAQQTPPSAVKLPQSEATSAQPSAGSGAAVLAREPGGSAISVADVLADLRRAQPEDRQGFLSKPDMLQRIASNLLVRRVLAVEGARDGLDSDPVVAAMLAIARDRILSDVRLARFDAQNTPGESALDAYAHNLYQVNQARFEKPAQTRARHILLGNKNPESLQKAKELLAQLRAGASFEELAKINSSDPGSAARGGDLGFFESGKMVPAFEEALNKLSKPGDLSEPVESQFGYHIIRLEERQEKAVKPYSEVRGQLLDESRKAMLSESRVQLVRSLSQGFVFENDAIEALAKSAAP